jgi:two-component system, OmpR family, sensor histidine kinase KdpD
MTDYLRPDPDEILKKITQDEHAHQQGKLKIFLGYAAGVGKTYAMLEAAHQRKMAGVDVVAGYIETHHRKDTDQLLNGLEIIPRREMEYRGTHLTELDADAVIRRHPQLVLIDELAHTNIPESRHQKRYQDIEDILDQGISVYTTLNIQHIETLNDIVKQITGVKIQETIPNRIIDRASELELIDLPPEELLERLKDGKVYIPEQAARAVEQFFRKGNLTALREISMRQVAERIDNQMLDYMENKSIQGPWPAKDRLLVAISSHPLSERLVRTTKKLADQLNAEWHAIYIETPERLQYSPFHTERVNKTIRLAEELGAVVVSVTSNSIPEAILDYAHKHNVTKIIAGKPIRPRWYESLRGSILDDIIRQSGNIDVLVMSDTTGPIKSPSIDYTFKEIGYKSYFLSSIIVALTTLISFPVQKFFHPTNLVMLYLAAVVIAALYLGRGPAILASILSVLAFDFFFIEPKLTFSVYDTQYFLTFFALLLVGLTISNLTSRATQQMEALQKRQAQTFALLALSRDLSNAVSMEQVLRVIIHHVISSIGKDVVILLPVINELQIVATSPEFTLDENELSVAAWAYKQKKPSGLGTDTLSAVPIRFQPLTTTRNILGIIGVIPFEGNKFSKPEQRLLLEGFTNIAALVIERTNLSDQARENQVLRESEKLKTAMLNSISHDLRSPLATITGALDSLLENEQQPEEKPLLNKDAKTELLLSASEETNRLNRLVGNFLDMTRLEGGALKLNREIIDFHDLISTAISHLRERINSYQVIVQVQENLYPTPLDFILLEQVFLNILDNAMKYSPVGSTILIDAISTDQELVVGISDQGEGIPAADLDRVFDKFFRSQNTKTPQGSGLGLSICKGIIEAHGGRIWAENQPQGGTVIRFSIPIHNQE